MSAHSPALSQGQHFFAEFDFIGSPECLVRKGTRVYLHPQNPSSIARESGKCVGVVWMCNPGGAGKAADPGVWRDILPDSTLRTVLDMYKRAVASKNAASESGQEDFILVLNCYYSVHPNSSIAHQNWLASGCRYRESIPKKARFIVAAWGAGKPQGPIWRAIRTIRQQRKKKGSKLFVVYVDAPSLQGSATCLNSNLAVMNYPLHPLNLQFRANLPNLAAAVAPFV